MKSRFVEHETNRLYLVERGSGSPVLVLHGFTGSASAMSGMVDALSSQHHVVAVDLIGHGRSDKPASADPYTQRRVLSSLDSLVSELDLAPIHLFGYSMGGRIALAYSIAHRDRLRSLVLVGASAGIVDPRARSLRRREDAALADRIVHEGVEWFVDHWMSQPLLQPRSDLGVALSAGARSERLDNDPKALANVLRGLGTGVMAPLRGELADFDLPVAVVAGEYDVKFRTIAAELVADLPHGCRYVIPDAGHAVHVDNPEGLAARVLPFLAAADREISL